MFSSLISCDYAEEAVTFTTRANEQNGKRIKRVRKKRFFFLQSFHKQKIEREENRSEKHSVKVLCPISNS